MDISQIPHALTARICEGGAVLFLGAGASIGAKDQNGEFVLSASELRDRLSDRFLQSTLQSAPLSKVAELAKSEDSLPAVQQYIRDLFYGIQPCEFHRLIPLFRWKAIVTTNYDLIIERAYQDAYQRLQELTVVVSEEDLNLVGKRPNSVPLLKLHGCITRIDDARYPLILASEEYAKHQKSRGRLFGFFQDIARSSPIAFCGYDLADHNVAQILWDLGDDSNTRPRYLNVNPALTEPERRYWASRRIDPVAATFEDFIRSLDKHVKPQNRVLGTLLDAGSLSISRLIASHRKPSSLLLAALENDFEHVHEASPSDDMSAAEFYRGFNPGWSPFIRELDIRRSVTDDLEQEVFLDSDGAEGVKVVLLKGHAGSGKSVTLRRVLWDGATVFDKPCFSLRTGGVFSVDALRELSALFDERIYVLVDDVITVQKEVLRAIEVLKKEALNVTIVLGSRSNEWNVYSDDLEVLVDQVFELRKLSSKEIDALIAKLHEHDLLGAYKGLSKEDVRRYFNEAYERQLLVALHEVTSGKRFEEIVFDEYKNLVPEEAKFLYLDICTLNKFSVGVRAGLISRISNIGFDQFGAKLMKPLEHVVYAYKDARTLDCMYKARHPIIAHFVFEQALPDQQARADQVCRVIAAMNTAYASDNKAFQELISGNQLAKLFSDKEKAYQIFAAASKVSGSAAHVEHQWGVFELNHPNGRLYAALDHINRADALAEEFARPAIQHTKALVLHRMANKARTELEKHKYREDAKKILLRQLEGAKAAYAYHALGRVLLDELTEMILYAGDLEDKQYDRQVWQKAVEVERFVSEAKQRFPDDEYITTLEASFAESIDNAPKATAALERAFEQNPGSGFVATRLARQFRRADKIDRAKRILHRCLESAPTEKQANLQMALLLIDEDERTNRASINIHLRRAFTEGDSNYEAQFWFARQEYLYGDRQRATKLYRHLRSVPMPPKLRNKLRAPYANDSGQIVICRGEVKSKTDNFCFIKSTEIGDDVFCYYESFDEEQWDLVAIGDVVAFQLGFSLIGPKAFCVKLIAAKGATVELA